MKKIILVVPEAPNAAPAAAAEQRAIPKSGLRLGVLDNGKGNADHLLRLLTEGLKSRVPVASVMALRKSSVSLPAAGDILDELAAHTDLVVSAMAD
ncbi:MAG TPA: hypothetical protein VGQ54_11460 [Burkholderiales bacterium]|jgi:hypothetical protein|nr:hypothetical protein [Burkholderiales bacterium]